ncbi:hypothetical protein MMC20_002977 [Loxospora ochrophaea]|nr:hypothetical protein [Loxospora ochrophaea]
MNSIGKFQRSIATQSNEVTLALANLNFDFSIFKVEAPTEYKQIGASLSKRRCEAAEVGPSHMTARKLGSLFESLLPATPTLTKAYGLRASEILASHSASPGGAKSHGPFAEFVGIDGTTIWAAATSGSGAIAVHLLACMLARIWTASEATSIWEELVAERKIELDHSVQSGSSHLQDMVAAQLVVSKEQLSEWDTSARAWLRAADEVELVRTKQKQLMLILDNIRIPVNNKLQVYRSVMEAWKTALSTMDNIIGGASYSIQDGAVLLALSSWHLFPDMIVLGSTNTEVKQRDSLIHPGGVLTIGLQSVENKGAKGIQWSLSLAHLRYYGDPVLSERLLGSSTSRMSMDQFVQVALGCVFWSWDVNTQEVPQAARLMTLIYDSFRVGLDSVISLKMLKRDPRKVWIKILADAADFYLRAKGDEYESCRKLIELGMRRHSLLTDERSRFWIFGKSSIVALMATQEDQITFLRAIAAKLGIRPQALIIRLRDPQGNPKGPGPYSYLTALPQAPRISTPRDASEFQHIRWKPAAWDPLEIAVLNKAGERCLRLINQSIETAGDGRSFTWHKPPSFYSGSDKPVYRFSQFAAWYKWQSDQELQFEYYAGDLASAALMIARGQPPTSIPDFGVDLSSIMEYFEGSIISSVKLAEYLASYGLEADDKPSQSVPGNTALPPGEMIGSLRALASAVKIYKKLPGASIATRIFDSEINLGEAKWRRKENGPQIVSNDGMDLQDLFSYNLSRAAEFACIAMFESGTFDFAPTELKEVMAISSEHSMFVAPELVSDPQSISRTSWITRVVGNIGRAGLALLIPPSNPKVRSRDAEAWELVNHAGYDGKVEDCFRGTSLHLGFSGYERALVISEHGGRHTEAFFIEAVVSVHDKGHWVGDLDVRAAYRSERLFGSQPALEAFETEPTWTCRCSSPKQGHPSVQMTAIDSWEELLDPPDNRAVVRAHNNWQARLAAGVLSVQLKKPTFIFSGCWSCFEREVRELESQGMKKVTQEMIVIL